MDSFNIFGNVSKLHKKIKKSKIQRLYVMPWSNNLTPPVIQVLLTTDRNTKRWHYKSKLLSKKPEISGYYFLIFEERRFISTNTALYYC